MIPFIKCPICGGQVIEKDVEKILLGGNNTAIMKVRAEVCLQCGERIYPVETIKKFEQVRIKLKNQEVSEFQVMGHSYQIA